MWQCVALCVFICRFVEDPRNLVLMMAFDGVQTYEDNQKYSATPFVFLPFNAPAEIRWEPGVAHLACIVPGSNNCKVQLQSVMDLIIDDLNEMYVFGVEVWDAYRETRARIYCELGLVGADYRALAAIMGLHQKQAPSPCACFRCLHGGQRIAEAFRTAYDLHVGYVFM